MQSNNEVLRALQEKLSLNLKEMEKLKFESISSIYHLLDLAIDVERLLVQIEPLIGQKFSVISSIDHLKESGKKSNHDLKYIFKLRKENIIDDSSGSLYVNLH